MTTNEAEWLGELLMGMSVVNKPLPAILLHYDIESVMITIVGSAKENLKCTRHVKS
jgi:hypothetical protein